MNLLYCRLALLLTLCFYLQVYAKQVTGFQVFENSDGSDFEAKSFYPKFSWDVVPQYFMFGTHDRLLKEKEVQSIAQRTDFLCIEKAHGIKELGAAELGAKHEVAAFKKIKPDMKVLFYFNSAYAWPFTTYNKAFKASKINKYPELKSFLLRNSKTGKLEDRRGVYFFDVLNPNFREWWVETVAKGVQETGSDGAFIDQMHGFVMNRPEKREEIETAMGKMMASLKEKLGPDKILLGNNAQQDIAKTSFSSVDATMFEHYNYELLSKESLLDDWQQMLRIAKAGKISVFRIGVEYEPYEIKKNWFLSKFSSKEKQLANLAKQMLEYHLACYLIGAQPYSYFQYGWGWKLSSGSLYDYPEMHKPLGAPKGPYIRLSENGWQFTREFEHVSVWVDTDKREGKITWRKP